MMVEVFIFGSKERAKKFTERKNKKARKKNWQCKKAGTAHIVFRGKSSDVVTRSGQGYAIFKT